MKITAIGKLIGVCISPSMLLSACGPQPAPTAAPTAPIATGKACEGVRIVFFPGGYAACPFGTILHNGAATAAEHLGADVKYMSSDWDPDKMARQFKEAIVPNPMGSP